MWGDVARRRMLGLLAVGALAAGAGLAARAANLMSWLERGTVDARFSLRGRQHPPASVLIVGIDNTSLGQLPRYPFARRLHARVLARLHAAGARLIVYDIAFDRPTTVPDDLALFDSARRAAPVVFATSLISPAGATQVLGGDANLASIGDQAGAADLVPDPDGVLRHTIGMVSGLPSIAGAVARRLGHVASSRELEGGWIDFRGGPGTVSELSFVNVLRNQFDPRLVRGKVVVVGSTASVLQDLHSTSAGSPMSGPEVQAEAISTALAGVPLRSAGGLAVTLLIIGLAFIAPVAGIRLETLGVGLLGLGTFALWSFSTQLAFDSGAMLDYSDPLLALTIGTAGSVILGMFSDGRERRLLRMRFAADQSGLVEQTLHAPGERALEPTAIIAGYRIEEVLGRGGMGVVYRATQLALERAVAVKLIATERAQDPEFRARFRSESRIAASIEHANVIPVYEAGEDDGLLFIAMRLVDGIDLEQMLAHTGPLEPAGAASVISQIGGALDAAHERGLVHRDVKPANVLLTCDEPQHAYLTDFGIAKHVGAVTRITRADRWVGTLDYLSPEQIRGEEVGASADVYALTGVLFHCLTGRTPFLRDTDAATMWAHISAPVPAPSRARPGLPGALDEVIAQGMAKDPAERFASAGELARACTCALGIADTQRYAPAGPTRAAERAAPGAAAGRELPGESAPTALFE